jgi:hypothetical protein
LEGVETLIDFGIWFDSVENYEAVVSVVNSVVKELGGVLYGRTKAATKSASTVAYTTTWYRYQVSLFTSATDWLSAVSFKMNGHVVVISEHEMFNHNIEVYVVF